MSTAYSRTSPSPRYRELLDQYRDMHVHGEQFQKLPPEQTFAGQSLPRHSQSIKALIDRTGSRTILDYGAGKGAQYRPLRVELPDGRQFPSILDYWGIETLTCYDPGYEPFSNMPTGQFDGVICTDVLEHCPESDIPWIVGELFGYAKKFVFANVACYPAKKRLANGENAHCTIKAPRWWQSVTAAASAKAEGVRYQFQLEQIVARPDGKSGISSTIVEG